MSGSEFLAILIGSLTSALLLGLGWLIKQPLDEIRDDVKEMKANDKEFLSKLTSLELRTEKLEDWRAYHLEISHFSEKRRQTDEDK